MIDHPFVDVGAEPADRPRVTARGLATAIAARFRVDPATLLAGGPKRARGAVQAARAAYYAALREPPFGWSLPQIGRFVGRHHSTVLDALRKSSQESSVRVSET
jgi:chromosomal replication initiation ATPase DnaA